MVSLASAAEIFFKTRSNDTLVASFANFSNIVAVVKSEIVVRERRSQKADLTCLVMLHVGGQQPLMRYPGG